jgi:hypothetical protein
MLRRIAEAAGRPLIFAVLVSHETCLVEDVDSSEFRSVQRKDADVGPRHQTGGEHGWS